MTVVLELREVRRRFAAPDGWRTVLDGVDLRVGAGEVVAVAGRSGSGKTTLLALIAGWDEPDDGTVSVLGGPPGERPWRELAILPQSLGLLDELSIRDNLTLPGRLARDVPARRADELLDRLGLAHLADRCPDEVSLGEQQRAALARAAVLAPRVLVADEPISHQNREWAMSMMALIGGLAADGTACVLATHDELAFDRADRVLDLTAGRLHERSSP